MGGRTEDLTTRAVEKAYGRSDDALQRDVRSGAAERVQPGIYTGPGPDAQEQRDRHVMRARAAMLAVRSPCALSHASAALMHGLPDWGLDLRLVGMTKASGSHGGRRTHRRTYLASLADDTVVIDGVAVTSAARTVVDLARTVRFRHAVAIGDAALHRGLVEPEELVGALCRAANRKGVSRGRAVLEFLDGRSESVGESWSRVMLQDIGLPKPTLQRDLYAGGVFLGRPDFLFEKDGIVGEFDGKVKYTGTFGEDGGDVVFREKRREDRMRAAGYEVVRWTWADLAAGRHVLRQLFRVATDRAAQRG